MYIDIQLHLHHATTSQRLASFEVKLDVLLILSSRCACYAVARRRGRIVPALAPDEAASPRTACPRRAPRTGPEARAREVGLDIKAEI